MSTTEEKIRALEAANSFLVELLDSKKTPRVPMAIRVRAQRVLRHLPTKIDIATPKNNFRFKPEVYKHLANGSATD